MKDLMDKKWETYNGRKARIVCTDVKGKYPIVALVDSGDGTEVVKQLTSDLKFLPTDRFTYIQEA